MSFSTYGLKSVLPSASLSVAEIFSGPFLLNIPMYQRPYSWGREEAGQLLEDVLDAAGLDGGLEPESDYFLGTVLLMDTSGINTRLSPKLPAREFDIVDGQQRLVTMMTLFAVLRDLENNARGAFTKRAAPMITAQQGTRFFRTERFRLHLSTRDRDFFERYVLKPGSTLEVPQQDGQSGQDAALLEVRDHLLTELKQMSEAQRARLGTYLADNCHLVAILSHDIDRAHRMFIVLNERGKKLRRNDILKADLLSRVSPERLVWAEKSWDSASDKLGESFEDFFAHVRSIHGYKKPQIISGVRSAIKEHGGAEPFLRTVFLPLAASYSLIKEESDQLPQNLRRPLLYLNRLPAADWAPAAMLALSNWQSNPEYAAFLLNEIDRLAHLLRLLCLGTGKRVRKFADVVAALRGGMPVTAESEIFQLSREETRNIAYHLRDLHRRNPKICKLLLLRLSDEISGSLPAPRPDDYTIEHVLPQRPSSTSEWRRWFPSADDRGRCTENIGNLVLISEKQNDKARNASFATKKEIYLKADAKTPLLATTQEIMQCSEWHRFEIEAREERMIEWIEKIWRIDLLSLRSTGRDVETAEAKSAATIASKTKRGVRLG